MHDKSNRSDERNGAIALATSSHLLVDAMLGRLARWLRLMGYDTAYISTASDHQIAARARAEGRLVLTRDRELARRRGIHCLLIRSMGLREQIKEVFAVLGPPPPATAPRCPQCNEPLAEVAPQEVRARVPAYVWATHQHFRYCAKCDKVYWQGSHWQHVQETVERLLEERDERKDRPYGDQDHTRRRE